MMFDVGVGGGGGERKEEERQKARAICPRLKKKMADVVGSRWGWRGRIKKEREKKGGGGGGGAEERKKERKKEEKSTPLHDTSRSHTCTRRNNTGT